MRARLANMTGRARGQTVPAFVCLFALAACAMPEKRGYTADGYKPSFVKQVDAGSPLGLAAVSYYQEIRTGGGECTDEGLCVSWIGTIPAFQVAAADAGTRNELENSDSAVSPLTLSLRRAVRSACPSVDEEELAATIPSRWGEEEIYLLDDLHCPDADPREAK